MLITPIFLIGVISVLFVFLFVMKFPVEEFSVTRAQLLNPVTLIRSAGQFISANPGSVIYVFWWAILCISAIAVPTTVITRIMSKSLTEPLDTLTKSVENIKNGRLNFEVMGSDYDELNALCEGFDSMRRALLASRRREEELKEEQKLLIANISHDLKTPVTSIKGYIDGINDGVADTPEKLAKYLSTIRSKADAIESLANNLRAASVTEKAEELCTGDIRELLYDILDSYRLDLEACGIKVTTDFAEGELIVRIDGKKMKRVFSNIIENTIKYRRADSQSLIVRAFAQDGSVYIHFTDDGIGIDPAQLASVFDIFYRADTSRTSLIQGNGLGLGIAKGIVEAHGGKIWLTSAGEGKGTTAAISLPQYKEESNEKDFNNRR